MGKPFELKESNGLTMLVPWYKIWLCDIWNDYANMYMYECNIVLLKKVILTLITSYAKYIVNNLMSTIKVQHV